jgi:hypothetical protein
MQPLHGLNKTGRPDNSPKAASRPFSFPGNDDFYSRDKEVRGIAHSCGSIARKCDWALLRCTDSLTPENALRFHFQQTLKQLLHFLIFVSWLAGFHAGSFPQQHLSDKDQDFHGEPIVMGCLQAAWRT